ncbi:MAG: exopolyphosphatase, partial [Acidihalobacter sp.]
PETVAAVDLGSNSFHMIVARIENGHVRVQDRLKEMVRLGGGLDDTNHLKPKARQRAIACLQRFGERVSGLPRGAVRAVGTNTLRKARNADEFLPEAEAALGHPIEIISGVEEARLIYLGVAHSLADDGGRRLVVDIGGGSTELIVGERFEPLEMQSLYMGCVSMTQAAFPDGEITAARWREADTRARLEIRPIEKRYRQTGWNKAIGASGTVLAVASVVQAQGWCQHGISLEALQRLRKTLIDAGGMNALDLDGLSRDRAPVFPGGVAVLLAVFEALGIEHMDISDGALREGLIYDLLGRIRHEDVRTGTIDAVSQRFGIDVEHAKRVEATARQLFGECAEDWGLQDEDADLLDWAARLHEIGLAVAHNQYHKHSAYLLENMDLAGFSRPEQRLLALLVRAQRRKFPYKLFEPLSVDQRNRALHLAMLLRLAILLQRTRGEESPPIESVQASGSGIKLRFEPGWLEAHALPQADLEQEQAWIKPAGLKLKFS